MIADFVGYRPLKIKVDCEKDFSFLSSCLQDTMFPPSSMNYNDEDKSFMILGNRFCWECVPNMKEIDAYYRVHTVVKVENVLNIHQKNIQKKLLTILMATFHDQCIHFVFSNHSDLKLRVSSLALTVKDIQSPWVTTSKPTHQQIKN
jgi:hypothetical protein